MTESLTWAQFAEKYQPKDGDKFLDDRGNEWVFERNSLYATTIIYDSIAATIMVNKEGLILTCPLIPPKAKRKFWPAIYCIEGQYKVSQSIYESKEDAKKDWTTFVYWPAIPGPDGSFEVQE